MYRHNLVRMFDKYQAPILYTTTEREEKRKRNVDVYCNLDWKCSSRVQTLKARILETSHYLNVHNWEGSHIYALTLPRATPQRKMIIYPYNTTTTLTPTLQRSSSHSIPTVTLFTLVSIVPPREGLVLLHRWYYVHWRQYQGWVERAFNH